MMYQAFLIRQSLNGCILPQPATKVSDVPDGDTTHRERFLVCGREPGCEFPQVVGERTASVGTEIVTVEKPLDKGCLPVRDRDILKNIIARILHGLSPTIGHEVDTETR